MLSLNTQLVNTPIMSLQTGGELGYLDTAIIDPRKLQVIAYFARGPRITETSILHTSDIREIGPLGVIVDDSEVIMGLDDSLVRLQEVLKFNFELIGVPVIDELKNKLGKVAEYTLETDAFYIQKLHVAQSVIKNITNSHLIIHRTQIVELTNRQIIVRSGTTPNQTSITQAFNPFRKNQSLSPELLSDQSQTRDH